MSRGREASGQDAGMLRAVSCGQRAWDGWSDWQDYSLPSPGSEIPGRKGCVVLVQWLASCLPVPADTPVTPSLLPASEFLHDEEDPEVHTVVTARNGQVSTGAGSCKLCQRDQDVGPLLCGYGWGSPLGTPSPASCRSQWAVFGVLVRPGQTL